MPEQAGDLPEHGKEHESNSPELMPGMGYREYYRDDMEDAGGLKVKFKIRMVSGKQARSFDARQAEAIRELLIWAHHHPRPAPPESSR
jgi:hypothetical protein